MEIRLECDAVTLPLVKTSIISKVRTSILVALPPQKFPSFPFLLLPSPASPEFRVALTRARFLAKYFNEVKDSRAVCGANRQILPVGQLLRAIFMMMDSGKLNESSSAKDVGDVDEICAQSQAEGGMNGEGGSLKGDKSLDTMMIDFIMYKKKD
jgi:hypothetical protein